MQAFLKYIFLPITLLALYITPSWAITSEAFVHDISERTLKIIEDKSLSAERKEKALTQLFLETIDTQYMARLVLGKHWQTAANSRKTEEFISTYQDFLLYTYMPKFLSENNADFKVLNQLELSPGNYLVYTAIDLGEGQRIKVNYTLTQRDHTWKVIDISIENISFIATQRAEFDSIITKGSIEEAIELMRQKVEDNKGLIRNKFLKAS